jgi:hypothetical protein
MLNHLISLADYFDQRGKSNHANVVDTFIVKAQSIHDLETEIHDDQPQRELVDPDPTDSKIPIDDDVFFDLNSPLGQLITSYMNNVFNVADEGTSGGAVSVKDINEIIDLAIRTNGQTLEVFPDMNSNPNPIYPVQFRSIIFQAREKVNQVFDPVGEFDSGSLVDLVEALYKNYEDTYLEDYMGLESSQSDFMGRDMGSSGKPSVTPQQIEDANRKQDAYETKMKNEQWFRDLERDGNPEAYKKRVERERQYIKEQSPEEWHDLLVPPE